MSGPEKDVTEDCHAAGSAIAAGDSGEYMQQSGWIIKSLALPSLSGQKQKL